MSALVFQVNDDSVLIASDTLTLSARTREPVQRTDKAFCVPHAGAIVTGTGVFEIVRKYYMRVLDGIDARSVDDLNERAPRVLNDVAARTEFPQDVTTTIFHFGFSPSAGRYVGYDFHSGRGYEPREIEKPFAAKPTYEDAFQNLPEEAGFTETAVQVISNLKEIDDEKGADRLGIGGEVQVRIMEGQPPKTHTWTVAEL